MGRKNLRRLREEKGYTQKEIAESAKISERYYQKIEYGKTTPNVCIFLKVTKLLGVDTNRIEFLLEQSE